MEPTQTYAMKEEMRGDVNDRSARASAAPSVGWAGISSCDVSAQSISRRAMASAAKLRLHAKVGDERLALVVTSDLSVGECAPQLNHHDAVTTTATDPVPRTSVRMLLYIVWLIERTI